jgi:hypothetical protein
MPGIDRGKAQDVFEESAICVGILAIDDYVRTIDYCSCPALS